MPRNLCRSALIQKVLESDGPHTDATKEEAIATLDRVVREKEDVLVPFACGTNMLVKYITRCFDARKWVESHLRQRKQASYRALLARAYLSTPGLRLPEDMWADEAFTGIFFETCRRFRTAGSSNNLSIVREHPIAGSILHECEQQYPVEMEKYLKLYDALVATLEVGFPPREVTARLGGEQSLKTFDRCIETLETLDGVESDVDVNLAVARGNARQKRREGKWQACDVNRIVSLLDLYVSSLSRGIPISEIGERYEDWRMASSEAAYRTYVQRRITARNIGCWRIRKNQSSLWREALGDADWGEYVHYDAQLKRLLPRGVYSQMPRRHCNPSSVSNMKTTNLAAMRHVVSLFATPER